MASIASTWSLEAYIQIHQALTKGGSTIQPVTAFEECFYKNSDLKQVLQLHGINCNKFSRKDLLQALAGSSLSSALHDQQQQAAQVDPPPAEPDFDSDPLAAPHLKGADLEVLGWARANEVLDSTLAGPSNISLACSPARPHINRRSNAPTGANATNTNRRPCLKSTAASSQLQAQHGLAVKFNEGQVGAGPVALPEALQQQPQQHHPLDCLLGTQIHERPRTEGQQQHQQNHHHHHHQQQQQRPQKVPASQGWHVVSRETPPRTADLFIPQQQHHHHQQQQQYPSNPQQTSAAPGMPCVPTSHGAPLSMPPSAKGRSRCKTPDSDSLNISSGPPLKKACTAGSSKQQLGPGSMLQKAAAAALVHVQPTSLTAYGALPMARTPAAVAVAAARGTEAAPAAAAAARAYTPAAAAAATIITESGGITEVEDEEEEEGAAVAEAAVDMEPTVNVEDPHTQWLLEQLQALVDAGADADDSGELLVVPPGSLKGRRVAFALLEELAIQGAKGSILKLPAGVYQGRVLKYMGKACQPQLCEETCSQAHEFYQARVLPPDGSSVAAGRPVQLQLDLAGRLRCNTLEELMQLEPEQLQDAWVLLAARSDGGDHQGEGSSQTPEKKVAAEAATGKRGRKPGRASGGKKLKH